MLPYGWTNALKNPRSRKAMLVTINLAGADPTDSANHLALKPGSYCFSTHADVNIAHAGTGRVKPFLPLLGAWPEVTREMSRAERRVQISEAQITLLPDAQLATALEENPTATGRVDVWADGVTLENVAPRIAGKLRVARDRPGGPVRVIISDGDPDKLTNFPPAAISRQDFPAAPDEVVDVALMTAVLGQFPERVICHQIDRERRRFFICAPAADILPQRVQKGGVDLPNGWTIRNATSPRGVSYSEIVFERPVDEIIAGVTQEISCSGGVGISSTNALDFLLKLGGYKISNQMQAELPLFTRDFPMSAMINKSGNVLDIVRNLVAQTSYAFSLRRNEGHLIKLDADAPRIHMGVGTGLMFRIQETEREIPKDKVYNAFEILCGRDHFASSGTSVAALHRVYRDKDHGPQAIRDLCSMSESKYGRRFLQIEANDLAVDVSSQGFVLGCPGGERLADCAARVQTSPPIQDTYLGFWSALAVDLNWRIRLTDASSNFDATPMRVAKIKDSPNGPLITFERDSVSPLIAS